MNLVINNVKPSFSTSRFALAATYISHGISRFSIKSEKSLDDEYSPGTFEVRSEFYFTCFIFNLVIDPKNNTSLTSGIASVSAVWGGPQV